MFLVKKIPSAVYFVRDRETGQFMGFDQPTSYWSKDDADFAIKRQHGRRYEPKIEWEVVRVALPPVAEKD